MNFASLKLIAAVAGLSLLIVGGAYLYKQSTIKQSQPKQVTSTQTTNTSTSENTDKQSTKSAQVLPSLPASPSSEQSQKYSEKIIAMATDVNTLTFTQCKANPLVVKFKAGGSLTVKNNDKEGIVVYIGPESLAIEGGKSQTIQPKLSPAQYSVACQHSAKDYNSQAAVVYVQ